jgi:hypothetical protein
MKSGYFLVYDHVWPVDVRRKRNNAIPRLLAATKLLATTNFINQIHLV